MVVLRRNDQKNRRLRRVGVFKVKQVNLLLLWFEPVKDTLELQMVEKNEYGPFDDGKLLKD